MSKFNIGDYVLAQIPYSFHQVVVITGIEFDSNNQFPTYRVEWISYPNPSSRHFSSYTNTLFLSEDLLSMSNILEYSKNDINMSDQLRKLTGEPEAFSNSLPLIPSKSCTHQWQPYEGFTDKYEFCSKCDLKR